MYCVACGTTLGPGLSYCNRCGASLKERTEPKSNLGPAFLTAITVIAVAGLGIMLGGAVKLKREAEMDPELVGFFLLFSFIIILFTEVLLVRQLSRSTQLNRTRLQLSNSLPLHRMFARCQLVRPENRFPVLPKTQPAH